MPQVQPLKDQKTKKKKKKKKIKVLNFMLGIFYPKERKIDVLSLTSSSLSGNLL